MRLGLKLVVLSVALALLAASTVAALTPPSQDFEPSNRGWNGLEAFFNAVAALPIDAAEAAVVPENSAIFVIGPERGLDEKHVQALKNFVLEGGTLVVLDESGNVNPLLAGLGLKAAVDGRFVIDAVFYHKSWKVPKVINVKPCEATVSVESIVLNLPSKLNLENGSNVKVLAYSSSFSFLDLNGDFTPSEGEPAGPFPVALEASIGRGRVYVFSDSSLFLNSVIGLEGNLRLLRNLVSGRSVYVDVSVWPTSPQLLFRSGVLNAYRVLATLEVRYGLALTTVATIYAFSRREAPKARGPDEVEALIKRHPGWDRRILKALKEARDRLG